LFAEKIGISKGRLSEIEQGKTKPSAEALNELRKQFNVDLNWLFEEDN
jgi:transcriptional regulator with XRE-family HTH domain